MSKAAEDDEVSTAALIFAHFLGIDIEKEHHLLYIAEDALSKRGLPAGWELGIGEGDNDGIPYFFNTETEESVWNHPREAVFQRKVKEEKEKDRRKAEQKKQQQQDQQQRDGNRNDNRSPAPKKQQRPMSEAALSKPKEVGMEVMDFEDIESEADNTPAKGTGSGNGKSTSAAANGVVTANSGQRGFGLQATDFFSDDSKPASPAAKPVNATTITTTTSGSIMSSSSTSGPAKPGTPKPVKPTGGKGSSWASAGNSNNNSNNNNNKKEASPPGSPGSLARVTGPPLASRGAGGGRDNKNRDNRPSSSSGAAGRANDRDRENMQEQRDRERERPSAAGSRPQQNNTARQREQEMHDRDLAQKERERRDRDREREREREQQDRDRDREQQQWEREKQRERDMREREQRERGGAQTAAREREREREVLDLQSQLDIEKQKVLSGQDETQALRDKLRRAEEYLEEERNDRRETENRLHKIQNDSDERIRDLTDKWEERVREANRSGKQELESDWKDRMKNNERRAEEDLQETREELRAAKIRGDDALKEIDSMRRKISQSREDGKLESTIEMERLRGEVDTSDSKVRAQGLELRKLREDHVDIGGRLAAALQQVQVAQAEGEAAKSQAAGIVAEGKSSHTALVQATNRIQILDGECAKLKAENLLHRREIDAQQAELRKLQTVSGVSIEKVHASETESRRVKSDALSEVSRLTSKCSEQEAIVDVLRAQLEKAQSTQEIAVHDVERQLDRTVFESHRLQEQVKELEGRCASSSLRSIELEKKMMEAQDSVFRTEHLLREEQQRKQNLSDIMEEQRTMHDKEMASSRESLHKERMAMSNTQSNHHREIENLKQEVAERIPKISQAVAEKIEGQFQGRIDSETSMLRVRHETQLQDMKRELLEMQATYAEKEARQRAAVADDRAELERLRNKSGRQQQQIKELEDDIDDMMALRRHRHLIANSSGANGGGMGSSSGEAKSEQINNNVNVSALDMNEDVTNNAAVSHLQGQLAWMKQQLNSALDSTTEKPPPRPYASPYVPANERGGARSAMGTHNRVSFSPESLFQSPSTAAVKSIGTRGTMGTTRPEKTSDGLTAPRSVFSHIRFQGDANENGMPQDGADAAYDEQALPYGAASNQSAIDRSYAYYNTGPDAGSNGNGGISATEQHRLSEIPEQEFEGIQDGGFHEGYWKARYTKKN